MNKKVVLALMCVVLLAACVHSSAAGKKKVLRVPGGANIPPLGLSVDASYDPRLDHLAAGYKVINVAMVNQSLNIVYLNPEHDKWSIKLKGKRRSQKALHDLRQQDPKAWATIPEKARGLVGYPLALPVGARQVIDLFVPESIDVERFNELHVYLKSLNTRLEVMVSQ
jgi:hypothetical protein